MFRARRSFWTQRPVSPHEAIVTIRIERRDLPLIVGAALSLLLHVLALFVMPRPDLNPGAAQNPRGGPLSVSLAQTEQAPAAVLRPQSSQPPQTSRRSVRPPASPPPLLANRAPLASLPPLTPPSPQPETAPADDMFAQLQARRAQRQSADETGPSAEDRQGELNAQLNVERNMQALMANSARQNQVGGGVFEVRSVGYRHAEFIFRGWSAGFRRAWPQVIAVEQGDEPTIQLAIVKRVIGVIREHKTGDFTWESHRLGQVIRLSARPEDNAGLEEFMMMEFFPEMARARR